MQSCLNLLKKNVEESAGDQILFNDYMYWFSWDMMGLLAFDYTFGMLEQKRWRHAIRILRKGLEMVGPFSPSPWLTRLAFDVPIIPVVRDFIRMEHWCAEQMDSRIQVFFHADTHMA